MSDSSMIETARDFLVDTQNLDGGWGVTKGKRSQTEVTALTVLALHTSRDPMSVKRVELGLQWLTQQQGADGSWPLMAELPGSSWVTSLAVVALASFDAQRAQALRGAEWLLRQKGRTLGPQESQRYREAPETMAVFLNPDLQGWAWADNTFSWIEPTAYALLALKKIRSSLQNAAVLDRVREGELLIYDRMCTGGGWNYGNKRVLGEELPPYPDTTAVALIALQDHPENPANQLSLRALRDMLQYVRSGLTLSLAMLCFSLYGQDVTEWENLLAETYQQTEFLGETKSIALALLACGDGAAVFRI
jgi:hypothetical protein